MMRRREFIKLIGGATAWPLAARAQQSATPVVGFLGSGVRADSLTRTEALRGGLQEFGYLDGKNVLLEFRFAEKPEQLHKFAVELAQSQPAVIVTSGNAATAAMKSVGFKNSDHLFHCGRPSSAGARFKSKSARRSYDRCKSDFRRLGGKRLDLLHELMPTVSLVAILLNPNNPAEKVRDAQEKGREIGLQVLTLTATTEREVETAFESLFNNVPAHFL